MNTEPLQQIFDSHCHIFPDKIAQKASDATGNYYQISMSHDGTLTTLTAQHRKAGITACLVCSAATRPEQVVSINDFIAQNCAGHPEFVGFGSLHPNMKNPAEELDRMIGLGIKGIKLHADFQNFSLDCAEALNMFEAIDNRLPILLHMGDIHTQNTTPDQLKKLTKLFPRQRFIGAHFGGYSVWEHAVRVLCDTDIFIDTSSSLPFLTTEQATSYIHAYGVEKCLFGSDYPMWNPAEELAAFRKLDLTDAERRKILWDNAASLFSL